jgi:hypothetical protein
MDKVQETSGSQRHSLSSSFFLTDIRLTAVFEYVTEFIIWIRFINFEQFAFDSAYRSRLIGCNVCISLQSLLLHFLSSLVRQFIPCKIKVNSISGFRRDVDEICTLLGYYAASCGKRLPTFRDKVSVPSSRVKSLDSWGLLTLDDGTNELSRNVSEQWPHDTA